MKYLIQIHTGSLEKADYTINEIINKLDYIISKIEVTALIFGWYQDQEYNQTIVNYLKSKHILAIFKLPVFSEITDLTKEDNFVYYQQDLIQNNHFYHDDKFDFVCPSSLNNLKYIINIFDNIDKDVNFDGVFFDRIRYQSWSVKPSALYGCYCGNCRKLLKSICVDKIQSFKPIKRINTHYEYEDINANKIMAIKRNIITNQVKYLSNYYKQKNKIIGIDTFNLVLSDLVGQDLESLANYVDFIKPMNYYQTFAPAGIPYEFNSLSKDIQDSLCNIYNCNIYNNDILNISSSVETTKILLNLNTKITIGIDANYIDNICNASIDYVIEHINLLEQIGIKEVVLSWNSMLLTDELIKKLSNKTNL